ncbi:hypothetical protein VNI00_018927 [Paramarasmius palmivorus]|uniref:Uncharacterized protein n=1 Tax=Paramarasmius palmivorus TaxID=297713 RepID=A0AAW0AUV4_9AGAR
MASSSVSSSASMPSSSTPSSLPSSSPMVSESSQPTTTSALPPITEKPLTVDATQEFGGQATDLEFGTFEAMPQGNTDTFTTYQVDGETNNNSRIHDASGTTTLDDSEPSNKTYRTVTTGDNAVTNNDADLIDEGGNPDIAASSRNSHAGGSRRTGGLSFVTVNRASGTVTNNGSTLPVAYIERTQMRMLRMKEARLQMEARSTARAIPPNVAEEAKQRELEQLV